MAQATALLIKSPRTREEITILLELGKSKTAYAYIDALMERGLVRGAGRASNVRRDGKRHGVGAMKYEWIKS